MTHESAVNAEKQAIREFVWRALERERVARFPGAWGRIPNFIGAAQAAERLRSHEIWQRARVLKCNPDAPQLPVRRGALREGKIVYMPVPRLRQEACFIELNPERLGKDMAQAATIGGAFKYGRLVRPEEMRAVDLIVCGSVAASPDGGRTGKGGGFSDLEYALLAALEKVDGETPIATTVHPLQIVPTGLLMKGHDIPLDYIATPEGVIRCERRFPRPQGIYWELLEEERIAAIPILRRLLSEGAM